VALGVHAAGRSARSQLAPQFNHLVPTEAGRCYGGCWCARARSSLAGRR